MRIALVHDDLIQWGGAERLFEAFCEVWPEAPIYTSIHCKNPAFLRFESRKIITSFMQRLPLKERLYRHYFLLYPLAFENFVFDHYDVVLTSSTRFAHGVITRPETLHIAYINTPPRMFWEPKKYFESAAMSSLISPFLNYLRLWDKVASKRPDIIIANSKNSNKRIKKYYRRESEIIYPFVEMERFFKVPKPTKENYFLVVSRLNRWKRVDIAINACNKLKLPLKIIGTGPDLKRLQKLAGPTIQFLGHLTEAEVVRYYGGCAALIFPQEEDFGITPLECMAAGRPAVAYKAGGALETIIEGKVGEFFYPQSEEALSQVLSNFDPKKYSPYELENHARKFSKERFKNDLKEVVEESYRCFTTPSSA